jgi:pimeloyl-ACP methyl ester carboxylesterase
VGAPEVWTEVRGEGDPALVMLHGLNATSTVWDPVDAQLAQRWSGRRVLVDLPGHGRSAPLAEYSFGGVAAAVARALHGERSPVVVAGHSMGGVVAMALASGWFGLAVDRVVAIGVKVEWSEEDLRAVEQARTREPRWFDTREEAVQRFLRLAGIPSEPPPVETLALSGIARDGDRFRPAADPRGASIGAPDMPGLTAAACAPVRLACGERDPMVSVEQLRRFDRDAVELPRAGHNAQLDVPERVAALILAA